MRSKREPLAGGVFLTIGAIGGVFVGRIWGQTSAGLLIGLALGAALSVAIWLRSR